MKRWMPAALVAALVVSACGGGGEEGRGGDVDLVAADRPRQEAPAGAPTEELVAGLDGFTRAVEPVLAREGGNTVFSPTSLAVAFAMAEAGARGDTVGAISGAFAFPDQPGLHAAMNDLTASLEAASGEDVTLELANAIWAQSGFEIEADYLDTLATQYGAGVQTTDFADDPEGSRQAINGWVAEATRDRIPDLVAEGAITDETRAMLVNAVYLKAEWASQFEEGATEDAPFHRADGSTVDVPTMHEYGLNARYARGDGYTAVELPYQGGDLAMLVVVPDDAAALDDPSGLPGLGEIAGGLTGGRVDLRLPRWEAAAALDLAPLMAERGLAIPGGDLSGIAPDLEIASAVHAANITVDENGTEAAAATAVEAGVTSAPADEPVPITVDRPFLYAVRHVETGAPLFVGRVVDPST